MLFERGRRSVLTGRPSSRRSSTSCLNAPMSTPTRWCFGAVARWFLGSPRPCLREEIRRGLPGSRSSGCVHLMVEPLPTRAAADARFGRQGGLQRAMAGVLQTRDSAAPGTSGLPPISSRRRSMSAQRCAPHTVADLAHQITTPVMIADPEGEQFWPGQPEQPPTSSAMPQCCRSSRRPRAPTCTASRWRGRWCTNECTTGSRQCYRRRIELPAIGPPVEVVCPSSPTSHASSPTSTW